ncbi:MAG: CcmD family protein [Bacteroidota bacterium]
MLLSPSYSTDYDVPVTLVAQADTSTVQGETTPPTAAADSTGPIATLEDIPVQEFEGLDRIMLAEDRLPVVLAVVLVVWIGVLLMLARTDRRLSQLERDVDRDTSS